MERPQPRFTTIAGHRAQVIDRVTVLNRVPTLDALLRAIHIDSEAQVPMRGKSSDCADGLHPFRLWIKGVLAGHELRLERCTACGVVNVWDVSFDTLPGLGTGSGARRRHDWLGAYSAPRQAGRVYIGAPPG